ncbi:MAG: acetylhydrolase [Verrucomicrobiaceae bacterium]|nr:acetylhydrolase [Verrucomicrobiaceae bacterium]
MNSKPSELESAGSGVGNSRGVLRNALLDCTNLFVQLDGAPQPRPANNSLTVESLAPGLSVMIAKACVVYIVLLACGAHLLIAAPREDPLLIPDSDEGLPGAGPLRRSDWFRGVWRKRRGSWLEKTAEQKGSIVFLGDSITQGWRDDFGGAFAPLKVVNRGISGDTSRGLLVRLKEDVLALDPKAVVLMIGANDLAEKAAGEVVFGNVKLIIERLRKHAPEMPIVLCETFPCAPDNYRPVAEIRKINALYREAYRDDSQVTLVETYALFAGSDGASLSKYLPDRVHPNAAGYTQWARALRPVFTRLGLGEVRPGKGPESP